MNLRRPAAVLAVVTSIAGLAVSSAVASSTARLSTPEASLLDRMNAVRAEHGLAPLRADRHLEAAARFHSHQMLQSGVFAHGAFQSRLGRFDVTGHVAGENLAWGAGSSGTAAGIVDMWLRSPEHRANLLRPSFRRVGVGNLLGRFEGYAGAHVVTADFAG
jgi:uncharacterized protein YkwD